MLYCEACFDKQGIIRLEVEMLASVSAFAVNFGGQRHPFPYYQKTKLNSVVLVRKRTIPTERPQPAGEVSANFS
jgi:hypothetical protein